MSSDCRDWFAYCFLIFVHYACAMTVLHILLIADDPLARAGLAKLVSDLPDCQIVYQISSSQLTADIIEEFAPQVLLWDLGWEPHDHLPGWLNLPLPVVALLPSAEQTAVLWAEEIHTLLPRTVEPETLAAALQATAQGLWVLHPSFAHALLQAPNPEPARPKEDITPRELEVLQKLTEGLTNKAIAQQLQISEHTVKFHVNAIMGKLGAQSRTEAVVLATRLGYIML